MRLVVCLLRAVPNEPSSLTENALCWGDKTTLQSPEPIAMAPKEEKKEVEPLSVVLKRAGKKALGGGIAGALAMVAQVALLMWMRTVMNYQHANGLSTMEAIAALYAEGGITRLYQGWQVALLQAPISRFGDTAANAGMLALSNLYLPEP